MKVKEFECATFTTYQIQSLRVREPQGTPWECNQ
jgi:hypothetical protein